MLDAATIQRFENALPMAFSALNDLATSMANEGLSQAAIYHVFDSFRQYLLRDASRDEFHQAMILLSIEYIVGWKSQDSWWFDRRLTKDEIDEYRNTNA
jgi:hypothetical protein